ncbi:GNAT family N-acetyltransferase [Erythrobacter litoralis]|uniref:Putative acetyltransferase n=1 Tax=Erythrobacter litoralis (strain HTCC2594) TaxID=314225 RepID=Q2NB58_ERYLH|nr:GNAT family N-acetyltransferase [Erythrobacter litoralis]ABC63083.1 putative acetyltransferase [Erythrobacter litoralis HTCC2594]
MSEWRLRAPLAGESTEITALCLRSKAHWGYDAAFMEDCTDELTVRPDKLAENFARIAEKDGAIVGFVEVSRDGDTCELEKLFVDPEAMGQGVGRILFDAARTSCTEAGIESMAIAADPDAVPFYERMGAKRIGEVVSRSIPGRALPLLRLTI